jgi:hypothetical protein
LKCKLFYGGQEGRIVGYDNENGKGDQKHIGNVETRYKLLYAATMVALFLADVERMKDDDDE